MVGGWELFIYLLHWVLVRSPGSGGFCPRDIVACVASVGKVCHPRRITAVSSMVVVVFVSLVILRIRHPLAAFSACLVAAVSVCFGCCSFVVLGYTMANTFQL